MTNYIDTDGKDLVELLEILPCGKLVKLNSKEDGIYTYSYYWFKELYRPCIISETFESSPLAMIKLLLNELTDSETASLKRECENMLYNNTSNYI